MLPSGAATFYPDTEYSKANMDEGKNCSRSALLHTEVEVRRGQAWDVLYSEPQTLNPLGAYTGTWLSRALVIIHGPSRTFIRHMKKIRFFPVVNMYGSCHTQFRTGGWQANGCHQNMSCVNL